MTKLCVPFRLGCWTVKPADGSIENGNESRRLQPRVMALLCRFAAAPGELLSREQLIADVWEGRAMSDEPLHRCIAELRAALGDDCNAPRYIETLPRRGYRLLASVMASPATNSRMRLLAYPVIFVSILLMAIFAYTLEPKNELPRILVLPMQSSGVELGHELVIEGLTGELIASLARNSSIAVLSSATSAYFRGGKTNRPELLANSNVDVVVETSAAFDNGNVTIQLHLVDAKTDAYLFATTLHGSTQKIMALMDEVAEEVVSAIAAEPTAPVANRPSAPLPHDLLRPYLEAQHLWQKREPDSARQAVERLEKIIDSRPDFAPAYAHLAAAYVVLWNFEAPTPENADRAYAAIAQAISLDPENALARALSGVALIDKDPVAAVSALRRALELDPNQHNARLWLSQLLFREGYIEAAYQQIEVLYQYEPLSKTVVTWYAYLAVVNEDWETFNRLLRREDLSNSAAATFLRASAALQQADYDRAAKYVFENISAATDVTEHEIAVIFNGIGNSATRGVALETLESVQSRAKPLRKFWHFTLLILLEEIDPAIDIYLGKTLDAHDVRAASSFWQSYALPLRRNARFVELAKHFRLTDAWIARGANAFCPQVAETYICE